MSWARIALYYVCAIGLALYLQGELGRLHSAQQAPAATTLPFLEAVPERIDRLRAERDDLSIEFQRGEDGRWTVAEPPGVSCPNDIVDAVLDSLTSVPPIDVVDAGSGPAQYGLNPPRIRMRVETAGEIVSTIAFGELNPTRTAVYAKKSGKEEIYLLGLNARYYLDLIFENVRRQLASAGVAIPPGAGAQVPGRGRILPAPAAPDAAAPAGEPKLIEQVPAVEQPKPLEQQPKAETVPAEPPKAVAPAPTKARAPASKPARPASKPAGNGTGRR